MKPIIVFDSGMGGLSVLRELRMAMTDSWFIYVADDASFPIGGWEEDELRQRIITLFEGWIETYDPAMAVIACNTASTLALASLRKKFPQVIFVGTVPAIKPAAERTKSGLISVLATQGTVERTYTHDLIQSFAGSCDVCLVGSNNLAMIAEDYMRGKKINDLEIEQEIRECFVERDGKRTDIVALACTHFPFLANQFRRLAPWPVDWLDPAEPIARHAANILPEEGRLKSHVLMRDIAVFTSNTQDTALKRLLSRLGLELQQIA